MNRYTLAAALWLIPLGSFGLSMPAVAGPGRIPASIYVMYGRKDLSRGLYSNAVLNFRRAVGRDSRNVDAYVGLGRSYARLGLRLRAQESFAAALKIDPHSPEAEDGLHDTMTESEHEQYFRDIEATVKAEPNNGDALTTYAEELLERNRSADAKTAAESALRINPRLSHAECVLGRIALAEGRDADADRLLSEATRADDADDDAFAALGDLQMKRNHYAAAIIAYRVSVKVAPEHVEYHQKLAAALTATGETAGAAAENAVIAQLTADAAAKPN